MTLKLFGNYKSGNVYKVSLALNLLGIPYEEVQVGLGPGTESRTPEYLRLNPLGQIPLLETEDGRYIWQSNAILWYVAKGSKWLPENPYEQAIVMQWMCFEQYELEPNLAWARWICHLQKVANERRDELRRYQDSGYRALDIVEQQLKQTRYIAGNKATIADIALFAYIHNCEDGQMSLANFPHIRLWVNEIQSHSNYFPMSKQFEQFDYS